MTEPTKPTDESSELEDALKEMESPDTDSTSTEDEDGDEVTDDSETTDEDSK